MRAMGVDEVAARALRHEGRAGRRAARRAPAPTARRAPGAKTEDDCVCKPGTVPLPNSTDCSCVRAMSSSTGLPPVRSELLEGQAGDALLCAGANRESDVGAKTEDDWCGRTVPSRHRLGCAAGRSHRRWQVSALGLSIKTAPGDKLCSPCAGANRVTTSVASNSSDDCVCKAGWSSHQHRRSCGCPAGGGAGGRHVQRVQHQLLQGRARRCDVLAVRDDARDQRRWQHVGERCICPPPRCRTTTATACATRASSSNSDGTRQRARRAPTEQARQRPV